jgi:hypothetical protein
MTLRRRLERLEATSPPPPAEDGASREAQLLSTIPLRVKIVMIEAFEKAGNPAKMAVEDMDLPEGLKDQIKDAQTAGRWRGEPDTLRLSEPPPAAPDSPEPEEAPLPPPPTPAARDEPQLPTPVAVSFPKTSSARGHYVFGVPERFWRRIRL